MEKNPFSIYDFFGYLFPGFFFLIILVVFLPFNAELNASDYFKLSHLVALCTEDFNIQSFSFGESSLLAIIILIIAYILGHIISYLSSLTIEYLATRAFHYPSAFLLNVQSCKLKNVIRYYIPKSMNLFLKVYRVFLAFLLFPISTFILIFGCESTHLIHFITRPVDKYIRENIKRKFIEIREYLRMSSLDVNHDIDLHRIVMHYVFLNIPESHSKTDNYLALYGFLRAMSLCFCLLFDYLLVKYLLTLNFDYAINWTAICYLSVIYLISVLLFLGFMKFYRRFTLENYMAILTTNQS